MIIGYNEDHRLGVARGGAGGGGAVYNTVGGVEERLRFPAGHPVPERTVLAPTAGEVRGGRAERKRPRE
jgi:hypothetical protein